jgi:hypothetical protein
LSRFGRWIINGLALISLLLCVATAALWVRSYFTRDAFPELVTRPGISVQSAGGRVFLGRVTTIGTWWTPIQLGIEVEDHALPIRWQNTGPALVYATRIVLRRSRPGNGFGFGTYSDRIVDMSGRRGWNIEVIALPYWAICALFIAGAARLVFPLYHWRTRRREGLCTTCGYDLRATPNRCPECGAIVHRGAQESL